MLLWQQAERHYPALLQQVKGPGRRRRCEWMSWRELRVWPAQPPAGYPERPRRLAAAWAAGPVVKRWRDGDRRLWPGACSVGDDPAAAFDYASALVRAGDSGQVRMGELLLRDLHQRQPKQPAGAGDAGPERGAQ
ncbi:hypothetical protein MJ575_17015 [Klebsiella pneumoniae]|nr:hypothetical protein MJ575_17015 [Klebsiella pneumoniae]